MLPTFLGIGSPKAGSTWLYQLLASHPDVFMSPDRKEIHYFDLNFDRGPTWYERFFSTPHGTSPTAVGEFTPHYLYDADAPHRVRSMPSIGRFVVIVRNPVDRAFSHYRFRRRLDNLSQSFEEFLAANPDAIGWGRYGNGLSRWLSEFDRDQFLVLIFEQAVRQQDETCRALAGHLGVDPARFPSGAPAVANEGFAPKRPRLYTAAVRQARWLRRHDFDRVITLAKRAGLVGRLSRSQRAEPPPEVPPGLRARLWEEFDADVSLLERLAGVDLDLWRPGTP